MKKLVFDYEMKLSFSSPVTDHRFQLRCIPATGPRQQVIDVAVKSNRMWNSKPPSIPSIPW